jgi:prepilin-type N-terminal cleavage/methylation domain-containing protein
MKTINKNVDIFWQNISNKNKKAFTLVELIIVITILAVLATIAFVSYQGYTRDARDANRITNLQEIWKRLDIYSIKSSLLPSPENPVTITASWVTIWYQWTFWDTLSSTIKMTPTPLDPKDNTKYIYAINESKKNINYLHI